MAIADYAVTTNEDGTLSIKKVERFDFDMIEKGGLDSQVIQTELAEGVIQNQSQDIQIEDSKMGLS